VHHVTTKELNEILQTFPYSGYGDQEQRLASMLINWAENQATALEEAEISRNSGLKIRTAWNELTKQEQARLIEFLSRIATHELRQQASNS
jgi:excinuclease UvrABC nuclease subunit